MNSKISGFDAKEHFPLSLTCPAQGSPIPNFRYAKIKISNDSEPIGGSAPKISVVSKIITNEVSHSSAVTMSCPAQGSPVPSFR